MSAFALTGKLFFDYRLDQATIKEQYQKFLKEFSELAKGEFTGYLDWPNPEGKVSGATDCASEVEITDLLQNLCAKFNCVAVFRINGQRPEDGCFVSCGQDEERVSDCLNKVVTQYHLQMIFSQGDFLSMEEYRDFVAKELSQLILS